MGKNILKKVLCDKSITEEREFVLNKMRTVTPIAIDAKMVDYRYEHMKRVADISEELMILYLKEYDRCGKKYNSKVTSLTETDFNDLKEIKKEGLLKTVIFLGLAHDIYKFCETKDVDHGELAAEFFKSFCKKNKIKLKGLAKKMYLAIKYHSNKGKNLDNIYYKVLCDADILSHYFPEMFLERSVKAKITSTEYFKRIDKEMKDYKSKTPFFKALKKRYRTKAIHNMTDKIFKASDKEAKKEEKKKGN